MIDVVVEDIRAIEPVPEGDNVRFMKMVDKKLEEKKERREDQEFAKQDVAGR